MEAAGLRPAHAFKGRSPSRWIRAQGTIVGRPTRIRFGGLLIVARGLGMGYIARVTRHLLTRDSAAPAAARALLAEFAGDLGWRAGDATLVVSELVTNSVLHSDAAAETPIELMVEFSDRGLRVEVCDHGSAVSQESVQAGPSATGAGGLGLPIVGVLADAWGVEGNGKTCVWARFERPV
jgi:anti-sigma regulatory factor (Ser/Thr protein kinase)